MSLEQAYQTFIEECHELLQEMEQSLLEIDQSGPSGEMINSVFRAAHTIKGSSGLFGLDEIVAFTHVVESVLDRVRDGSVTISGKLVGLLLLCKDHILKLIESIENMQLMIEASDKAAELDLIQQLNQYLAPGVASMSAMTDAAAVKPEKHDAEMEVDSEADMIASGFWHISVHFGKDVLRNGMDPLSFLRYLQTLGTIRHLVTIDTKLPRLDEFDPESCFLGFEISFDSDADKQAIEDVFEFVREDCLLHVMPPRSRIDHYVALIEGMPAEDMKLGEILVECGTLTERELEQVLAVQARSGDVSLMTGELVVDSKLASADVVEAALRQQGVTRKDKDKRSHSVRIDAGKLDSLINLIGELVIAGASIESEVRAIGRESLTEAALPMVRLIEEVRDGALNLRMVPIGDTFNRFQRVVRDVSQELDKQIELTISGGDTELDKSVIEKITDPLTHLVRNAVDHGIEDSAQREREGKSPVGKVSLNAYHESGSIVIEVSDDGAGINADRVLAKAYDSGLVSSESELSEQDIFQLIFEPGFSTASQVSNISGRGVGMDVVRRNIEALRGNIEISSKPGQGTTMRIRLPLTLAIIDGFLMAVGESSFVVPLDIVEECIELTADSGIANSNRNFINLRGEPLPFINLRRFFNEKGAAGKRENIVVVRYGNQRAGLVVDQLMGEFQTVIKPMGAIFEKLKGISGSTILGSGEVALILDAPALIQMASKGASLEGDRTPSAYLH